MSVKRKDSIMIDPYDVPDRIPANDEPDLINYDRPEVDEDRAYEEYKQLKMEEEDKKGLSKDNSWPTKSHKEMRAEQ